MKTIAVAIVIALILIYKWGVKRIHAISVAYHKEKMGDKTVLEELIKKAWYGVQVVIKDARKDSDPYKKAIAENDYRVLDETYIYPEKRFELPMTIARLSELAKIWDNTTEEEKEALHDWLNFLSASS